MLSHYSASFLYQQGKLFIHYNSLILRHFSRLSPCKVRKGIPIVPVRTWNSFCRNRRQQHGGFCGRWRNL